MVHELARLVFTLPFNLRSDDDNSGYAFPMPDPSIRNYLSLKGFRGPESPKYDNARVACLIFFTELCKESITVLQGMEIQPTAEPTAKSLTIAWQEYLESPTNTPPVRQTLYKQVIKNCYNRKQAIITKSTELTPLIEEAASEIKKLIKMIDLLLATKPVAGDVRILLYFDKAYSLTNDMISDDPAGCNHFNALCSVLDLLTSCPLFAITLSTNSNLLAFSSPRHVHHSTRVVDGEDNLQALYTKLPFDCLEGSQLFIRLKQMTLIQTSEVAFMVKFGRPL